MSPRKTTTRSFLSHEDILRERLPVEIEEPERFDRWFEPLRRKVTIAVLNLHREVTAVLEDERKLLGAEEGSVRRAWQMSGADAVSLLKSAESVRSKLARSLKESEKSKPWAGRLSLDQVERKLLEFPDLGRFRIECDFSSDVQRVRRVLLGRHKRLLLNRFAVRNFKDYASDLALRHPARGHRALQFSVLTPADGSEIQVEVQLMTLLQQVWDQRNHPLYEWSRDGGLLPMPLTLRDVALAETLHLVDEQADRHWREFLALRRRKIPK